MQNETTLEQDVELALSMVFGLPEKDRYRCHEIARLLRDELVPLGHENVTVQTGIAQYDRRFLQEIWLEQFRQGDTDGRLTSIFEEELKLNPHEGKTPRISHSWVEVGDTIVDYQNNIPASNDTSYQSFLIVERRDRLEGKVIYRASGGEINIFGRPFIYTFTGRLPYFSKLRISKPSPK